MVCIKLCAKNDRNGNPRRVYVLIGSDGCVKRAIDEGYAGRGALDGVVGRDVIIQEFDTTPTEYRRLLRAFPARRPGA